MITIGIAFGVLLLTVIIFGGLIMFKSRKIWLRTVVLGINLLLLVGLFIWGASLFIPNLAVAANLEQTGDTSTGLGYLAAGLAVGIASIGAGIGVGIAGAAAIGAISEKPEILGRTLIFIGLAEGVAIYGLIISIMILSRL